ncbi:hypothetical protein A1O1_06066 [Capronia coronata CBS 617.96]|uniref:Cupin type-1 domain-containing protein n=1 Tax=Capronia coronata CBS 617.96 TaxID=1182541 RepID=W9XZN0_9EURO|nr:uncharacterized protein A1O1_06066 [Capronia coronata CBS 617.96]EXJ85698.1 hypothetical protein A1O1_06066 [Capronia coronata CBS 617.96]
MVEVYEYHLRPTALVPNSPQPLLFYKGLMSEAHRAPAKIHDLFDKNEWETQWIFRYGPTQESHYHSSIHECMAVLSGSATIRFGVADTDNDLERSTWGGAKEDGGVEIEAQAGDVFVIPAGVAHKTYNTSPGAPFSLLTPGTGRGIHADNVKEALEKIQLSGYTMMGAYPKNCGDWDFSVGGDDVGNFERSWTVPKPEKDPFLGSAPEGLCGEWRSISSSTLGRKRAGAKQ